jgi:hypothetical protein
VDPKFDFSWLNMVESCCPISSAYPYLLGPQSCPGQAEKRLPACIQWLVNHWDLPMETNALPWINHLNPQDLQISMAYKSRG